MTISPALPVAVPMLCATLIAALRRRLPRFVIDLIASLAALFDLIAALHFLHLSWTRDIVYWFGNWYPRGHMAIGIGFLIDPVGAALASMAAFLTFLALIYSWGHMDSGHNFYQPLMLIFLAAMTGFCFTADLFNLFVFFELMSTAAFALCGLKVQEPAPLQGAFNFAVTNTVGAFLILTGIALLYAVTGALNMAQIGLLLGARHDSVVLTACLFIVSGFLIKAAIVPFHFWLPDAHAVAPTPVCVLFSGIMVELGLFAVLRLAAIIFGSTFAAGPKPLQDCFLVLGGITAVWGGAMCFAEHHLKRLLAFSTISHAGIMLFAMGLNTRLAIAGWLLYVCAHAVIKSGLFFTAGILLHRLRSMSETVLFARGRKLKFTATLWFLGGCGLAGLPPFAGALAEDLIEHGSHGAHEMSATALLFVSGILTGGAVFRVFMRDFCGWGDSGPRDRSALIDEAPETPKRHRLSTLPLFIPATICVLTGIALMFVPSVKELALTASERFLGQREYFGVMYGLPAHWKPLAAPLTHLAGMIVHGVFAVICALLLAAWAVFHQKIPRRLRWASHLEGSMRWARQLQSGQAADYVTWAMVGVAVIGCVMFAMR